MQMTRRVALNGVWLDDVDSRIVISGIEPGDGRENISAVDIASGNGQKVIGKRRSTLDMVIRFRILEHGKNVTGLQARAETLEKVNAWAAGGGFLTVNYKPDRRLGVILAQAPGEGSLWDYSKEFMITFRAYTVPYWENETAVTHSFGGANTSGGKNVQVDGSAETQADVEMQNTSGMTVNWIRARVGENLMTFSNLGLGGSETLVIDHENGLLRIRIRNGDTYRSAMHLRNDVSANDFILKPGVNHCAYSTERACRMTVSWRARYI